MSRLPRVEDKARVNISQHLRQHNGYDASSGRWLSCQCRALFLRWLGFLACEVSSKGYKVAAVLTGEKCSWLWNLHLHKPRLKRTWQQEAMSVCCSTATSKAEMRYRQRWLKKLSASGSGLGTARKGQYVIVHTRSMLNSSRSSGKCGSRRAWISKTPMTIDSAPTRPRDSKRHHGCQHEQDPAFERLPVASESNTRNPKAVNWRKHNSA